MNNTVKNYREKYTKRAKTRRRFVACMIVIAAIVVVTVFYQLRGTGIARVNDITENIADLSDSTAVAAQLILLPITTTIMLPKVLMPSNAIT